MTTTNFTDFQTPIVASWLNDVNAKTYSDNAQLMQYTPAGTGAVATTVQGKLRESVSVKDFGAVGDGVTDDTAAIQAALTAVGTAGGGVVLFAAGSFLFSTLTVPANVTLRGSGLDSTYLKTATTGTAIQLTTSVSHRVNIIGLTLQQTGIVQGKGIAGTDCYWFNTEFVRVLGFVDNLYFSKSLYHSHKRLFSEVSTNGVNYYGAAGAWNSTWFNNVLTFDTCRFSSCSVTGASIKGCEVVFVNPDFSLISATGAIGLKVFGESSGYPAHGIKIITPYSELIDIVFSFSYAYVQIDGGFVQGGVSAGAPAATSIIDADNSQVWWNGRMKDQDYWDYGYRLTNSSKLTFDYGFSGSVRASNTVDATSSVGVASYTEGTWTPTLGGSTTYTKQVGRYTRIGRLINATGTLTVNAIGTGSQISIFGLPFVAGGVSGELYGGSVSYLSGSATSVVAVFLRVNPTTSQIDLGALTAAGVTLSTSNIFTTGTSMSFVVQYEV